MGTFTRGMRTGESLVGKKVLTRPGSYTHHAGTLVVRNAGEIDDPFEMPWVHATDEDDTVRVVHIADIEFIGVDDRRRHHSDRHRPRAPPDRPHRDDKQASARARPSRKVLA